MPAPTAQLLVPFLITATLHAVPVTYVAKTFTPDPSSPSAVVWNQGQPNEVSGLSLGTQAFTSIQHAVDATDPGGLVYLAAGEYAEGAEILIEKSLSVIGSGASETLLTGSSNGDSIWQSGEHRLLRIQGKTHHIELHGLTLHHGTDPASNQSSGAGGGGILLDDAELVLHHCVIRNNVTTHGGGGLHIRRGHLTVIASSISDNLAHGDYGGGIYLDLGGSLTVDRSTLHGNSGVRGGGIYNESGALCISRSTVHGNRAQSLGAGIYTGYGPVEVLESTITGNSVTSTIVLGSLYGGGIASPRQAAPYQSKTQVYHTAPSLTLRNSIVAGNSAATESPDLAQEEALIFQGTNFIGDLEGSGLTPEIPGLLTFEPGESLADLLETDGEGQPLLANHGGPTLTVALASHSRARNAGTNTVVPPSLISTDQRGSGYPRSLESAIDLGAIESGAPVIEFAYPHQLPPSLGTAANGSLSIAFNQDISPGSGSLRIHDVHSGALLDTIPASQIRQDGPVWTFFPQIDPGTTFRLEIPAGIVINSLGQSFSATGAGAPVFTFSPTTVYVAPASDFLPPHPAPGSSVVWASATATVPHLVFGTNAFSSLQDAIDSVALGGTILLAEGTYDEGAEMTICRSVTLQGEGADRTLLTGNSNGDLTPHPGEHRVLKISGSATQVSLHDLAIVQGLSAATTRDLSSGAAIDSTAEALALFNCRIADHLSIGVSDAAVRKYGGDVHGGAIACRGGSFYAENCEFSGNRAWGGSSLTSVGGDAHGGALAIYDGSLQLSHCRFTNNAARGGTGSTNSTTLGRSAWGGALVATGPAHITDSVFSENIAQGGDGSIHLKTDGGAYAGSGACCFTHRDSVIIERSDFANNSATAGLMSGGHVYGGAIEADVLRLVDSTVRDNAVHAHSEESGSESIAGGGIFAQELELIQSTISGNSAHGGIVFTSWVFGGGVVASQKLHLDQTTITGNSAHRGTLHPDGTLFPFYLHLEATEGGVSTSQATQITLRNSIIAGNTASSTQQEVGGVIVPVDDIVHDLKAGTNPIQFFGTNFLGDASDCGQETSATLLSFESTSSSLSDLLDPVIADLGGPAPTHALLPESPAVDSATQGTAWEFDQRGQARDQGRGRDLGAFELSPQYLTVTTANDENDAHPSDGNGWSLREAITAANAQPGLSIIDFDLDGTLPITSALPSLTGKVDIVGPGADQLEITRDSSSGFRILDVGTTANVHLRGLTLSNGNPRANGGGIANAGTLRVDQCTIAGNANRSNGLALSYGGGIFNQGHLTITQSAILNNVSAFAGGGISNHDGYLKIENTLIDGNSIQSFGTQWGGGIQNDSGTVNLTHVTLTQNSATTGANLLTYLGTVTLSRSIVALPVGGANLEYSDTTDLISSGFNLCDDSSLYRIFTTDLTLTDARLGPVGMHGGPTPSRILLADSPAIDAGDLWASSPLILDQRGYPRIHGSQPDIGATEYFPDLVSPSPEMDFAAGFATGISLEALFAGVTGGSGSPLSLVSVSDPSDSRSTIFLVDGYLIYQPAPGQSTGETLTFVFTDGVREYTASLLVSPGAQPPPNPTSSLTRNSQSATLSVAAAPFQFYQLESSDDLAPSSWSRVGEARLSLPGQTLQFSDFGPLPSRRFYRIILANGPRGSQ
ncbi:CSLREA domain-containing protein [Haloferula luteola]|uniref:CSLREA domain-containing protein n=1 Tax=Haloferula luteola TaxID=595692 RepID=A0A840V5A5_9BACT|nr:choice-of-anchor Q domain-containing protein [Haloferula luteola]MBB5352803.1 CSLREA domain-containing protein [Haloferula luteola]